MRIAFDGTTLRPYRTGVGYYTEHLLHHLLHEAPEDEFVVVSNRSVHTSTPLPDGVRVFEGHRFPVRNVWMQTLLPIALGAIRPNVAHFTNSIIPLAKRVPTVVTIHDMTLNLFPHLHPLRKQVLTRPLVTLAAHIADAIITVSHSARQDILRLTGMPAGRVHVIHEAAAPAFRPIRDRTLLESVRRRYGLAERLILYVGTIEPRKNLPRLIEAYARLHRAGDLQHQLVCVGPHGWGYQEVQRSIEALGLRDAIRLTGYVPFADLAPLYNLSEIFVFPSLYEGFGLPVVEAMACGTPVIAAGNSSFREIADGAVETVDPLRTDAIAEALLRLSHDADRRRELRRNGLLRAQEFSWSRAARETLAVYCAAIDT
ncbi:MAG: glycosyltransferase family 4 protein [Anaerolineae bacterium]